MDLANRIIDDLNQSFVEVVPGSDHPQAALSHNFFNEYCIITDLVPLRGICFP